MTEPGVNGWKMTEVGDDQVGLQYGLAGSDMVERDHAALSAHYRLCVYALYKSTIDIDVDIDIDQIFSDFIALSASTMK